MTTKEVKNVSVRADKNVVEDVDRKIAQAKADGDIPMDINRSDILRVIVYQIYDGTVEMEEIGEIAREIKERRDG